MRNTCLFIVMVMLATAIAGISTSPTGRTMNNSPASLGNGISKKRNRFWIPGTVRSSIPTMSSLTTATTTSRFTTSAAKFGTKELEEQKDKRLVNKFKVCLHGHCYKKTSLPTISVPITASTTRSPTFAAKFGTKELEERKHKRLLVKGRKFKVCWNHGHCYKQKLVCLKRCNYKSANHLGTNHLPGNCIFNCKKCIGHC